MNGYALIACTKLKRGVACPAKSLYEPSALFRKALRHCQRAGKQVLILSAKHGVVHPEAVLQPYDVTLKTMGRAQKRSWGEKVTEQLRELIPAGASVELHAGREYTQDIDLTCYHVLDPLRGLRLGERMRWYDDQT
jgi:hypothetical protein